MFSLFEPIQTISFIHPYRPSVMYLSDDMHRFIKLICFVFGYFCLASCYAIGLAKAIIGLDKVFDSVWPISYYALYCLMVNGIGLVKLFDQIQATSILQPISMLCLTAECIGLNNLLDSFLAF